MLGKRGLKSEEAGLGSGDGGGGKGGVEEKGDEDFRYPGESQPQKQT